jgi:hypothetical protein
MALSAVSVQHSAKDFFPLVLAESRQLMADRTHRKTAAFGWARSKPSLSNDRGLREAGLIGRNEGRFWVICIEMHLIPYI